MRVCYIYIYIYLVPLLIDSGVSLSLSRSSLFAPFLELGIPNPFLFLGPASGPMATNPAPVDRHKMPHLQGYMQRNSRITES